MEGTITDSQSVDTRKKLDFFFEGKKQHENFCPVRDIMDHFGDKWSLLVVMQLGYSGKTRFNELKNKIEGVSQRMLTVTLRSLERDGMLTRCIYAEIPPRVEYELTELGEGLLRKIIDLAEWASENAGNIISARQIYDKKLQ